MNRFEIFVLCSLILYANGLVYISRSNPYCQSFTGSNCASCPSSPTYYFYNGICTIFENINTDSTTGTTYTLRADSNCGTVEKDGSYKSYCLACSGNFMGIYSDASYKQSARCTLDCSYFGEYYSKSYTSSGNPPQPGYTTNVCTKCDSDCVNCYNSTICIDCKYSLRRYGSSDSTKLTDEVFKLSQPSLNCGASGARITKSALTGSTAATTYQYTYYLFPTSRSCTLNSCDGTYSNPYDDINLVFQHLYDLFNIGGKEQVEVSILLLKDGTTTSHYWLEGNLAIHYQRVFERTIADVTIGTAICGLTNCFTSSERATVYLKSHKLRFFVTKNTTVQNIIFDGSNLIPNGTCDTTYLNTKTNCCVDKGGMWPEKSDSTSDAECYPMTDSLSPPQNNYPSTSIWLNGPSAFFILSFISDTTLSSYYTPYLNITGCTFRNFWYHRYTYSLIYIHQKAGKLIISNSEFKNFWYPMGLITNTQNQNQRGNIHTINLMSTRFEGCGSYPGFSDCGHSVTITNSKFNGSLWGDFTLASSITNEMSNEGIVMFFFEFGGPIKITGSTFFYKFSANGTSAATCSDDSRDPTLDNYKTYLDRKIELIVGYDSKTYTPRTSSVLNIRNLTQGLTLYNNSFEENAAETGTALFIHRFENTNTHPIVIEANTFSKNFATQFGSAIAIVHYERDYVNMYCQGIYLNSNTFTNNFGCSFVRGTVVIQCIPEKPAITSLFNLYSQPQTSTTESSMLNYYLSVNTASQTQGQGQTSRENLQTNEYDAVTNEVFDRFLVDIDNYKLTVNSSTHPIFTTKTIDLNRITSLNNTFTQNFATLCHLCIQGPNNVLIDSTYFYDNTIPLHYVYPASLYSSALIYKLIWDISKFQQTTNIDQTPLMLRMINYIQVQNSIFSNNTDLSDQKSSYCLGAAFTIDKHIGKSNVVITNITVKDYKGFQNDSISSFYESEVADLFMKSSVTGIQKPLITYSYMTLIKGVTIIKSGTACSISYCGYRNNTPSVEITQSTFQDIDFKSPYQCGSCSLPAILRKFSEDDASNDGNSINTESFNTDSGTIVSAVYLTLSGCTFKNLWMKDGRSIINPVAFDTNNLTSNTYYNVSINQASLNNGTVVTSGTPSTGAFFTYDFTTTTLSISLAYSVFSNCYGRLIYITKGQAISSQFLTTYLTISNHESDVDIFTVDSRAYHYLMHITIKDSIVTTAAIIANSIGSNNIIYNISMTNVTSYEKGCLSVTGLDSTTLIKNISCTNPTLRIRSSGFVNIYSACFTILTLTGEGHNLTYLTCSGASLEQSGTITSSKSLGICLYMDSYKSFTIDNFYCYNAKSYISGKGSAFLFFSNGDRSFTMTNSVISGNSASNGVVLTGSSANFYSTIISSNTATERGSIILATSNSDIYLYDSTFESNSCPSSEGGVIVETGYLYISNSTFNKNSASNGAALVLRLSTALITSSTFKNNVATNDGSVMIAEFVILTITTSTFYNNSAFTNTISLFQASASITYSLFLSNQAEKRSKNIMSTSSTISIDNCNFTYDATNSDSTVYTNNGGFYACLDSSATITSSSFYGGQAFYGGAIYYESQVEGSMTITNCTFAKNWATSNGDVVYLTGIKKNSVTMKDIVSRDGSTSAQDVAYNFYCEIILCTLNNVTIYSDTNSTSGASLAYGRVLNFNKGTHSLQNVYIYNYASSVYFSGASAIYLTDITEFDMVDSVVSGWGDSTSTGGGVMIDHLSTNTLSLAVYNFENVTFKGNKAKDGGAIYALDYVDVTVLESLFDSNYAASSGGALYWSSTTSGSSFSIKNCTFNSNNALTNGGAHAFTGLQFNFSGVSPIYSGNTALYGNDKAGYAVQIAEVSSPSSTIYSSYVAEQKVTYGLSRLLTEKISERQLLASGNFSSGEYMDPPFVLAILDEFGQIVASDNSSTCSVSATSNGSYTPTISGENPVTARNGYCIFYPLAVFTNPGSLVSLSFKLTSFSPMDHGRSPSEFTATNTSQADSFILRECVEGERITDQYACQACAAGTYTLLYRSTTACTSCPDGGVCYGYNIYGPDAGYWRLSSGDNALISCTNEDACLGADLPSGATASDYYCQESRNDTFCYTGWCDIGYTGHLCATCASGYAYLNSVDKTCTQCDNNASYIIIALLLGVAVVIYLLIMIKNALKTPPALVTQIKEQELKRSLSKKHTENQKNIEEEKNNDPDEANNQNAIGMPMSMLNFELGMAAEAKDEEDDLNVSSIYLKILTNYIQFIAIIGTFNFSWPSSISSYFAAQDKIYQNANNVFTFDCLLKQPMFVNMGLSSFFAKVMVMTIMPILCMIGLWTIWAIYYLIKYTYNFRIKYPQMKTNCITSIVVVLFIIHPSIVSLSIETFQCTQLGDSSDSLYLEGDLSVKCWGGTHLYYALSMGLPSLIIWGMGLPIYSYLLLKKHKNQLDTFEIKARFGFLYEGYIIKAYFWEFIIFYRKVLLILVSVFLSNYSTTIQGAIVIGISAVSYLLHTRTNPYLTKELNEMEKRSLIVSTFTIYCGLFYLSDGLADAVKDLFFVAMLFANIYFFGYFGQEFLKAKIGDLLKVKFIDKHCGKFLRKLSTFSWNRCLTRLMIRMKLMKPKAPEIEKIEIAKEEIKDERPVSPKDSSSLKNSESNPRIKILNQEVSKDISSIGISDSQDLIKQTKVKEDEVSLFNMDFRKIKSHDVSHDLRKLSDDPV